MDREAKQSELRSLKRRVAELEAELAGDANASWPPKTYYTAYHLLAGMILGFAGAAMSLLVNVVGAAMLGKHPLELIRVYLTFPLGEKALDQESGFVLAAGCCLYLGTGMIGGIPFHMILSRFFSDASFAKRFVVASVLAVGVWLINYYGLISWLQPALIGGTWILDLIPIPVALCTHLVFGWTVLLLSPWVRFVPYRIPVAENKT